MIIPRRREGSTTTIHTPFASTNSYALPQRRTLLHPTLKSETLSFRRVRVGSLLAKSQLERREKRERKSSVTYNNSSDSQSESEDGSDDDDDSDSTTSSSSYHGSNPSNFTEDDDDATYYSSDDDKKRISPRQHDPTLDILNSIVDSRSLGSSEFDRSFHSTFQDPDEWSNE
eukprot:g8390.t1 g8390   contig29:408575-409090(+)